MNYCESRKALNTISVHKMAHCLPSFMKTKAPLLFQRF